MEWECALCGETCRTARRRACPGCGTAATLHPPTEDPPEPGALRALWVELGMRADVEPSRAVAIRA